MSDMAPDQALTCPLGANDCSWLGEVHALRERVLALSELVITDELTGLFNFRHLLQSLTQEMERTHRTGHGFAVMMLDFDGFKQINDVHGHEFGNRVLRVTGDFLRRSLRKLDVPCRYGGEEFAVVLPGTSLADSVRLAERVRAGVAALRIKNNADQLVPVSVSIGVDFFAPAEHLTVHQLIDRTDQYLLEAKQKGRNRVCHPPLSLHAEGMNDDEKSALLMDFSQRQD